MCLLLNNIFSNEQREKNRYCIYLDTNGCEPVTVNNNYLDMLGHNPDNEAGVQYKLRTENRDSGPKLNSAVNQRTTEKNEMILAKFT